MTATKLFPFGTWEVSDIIDGHLVRRVFYGFNKRGALAQFREDTGTARPKRSATQRGQDTLIKSRLAFHDREIAKLRTEQLWEKVAWPFSDSPEVECYVMRIHRGKVYLRNETHFPFTVSCGPNSDRSQSGCFFNFSNVKTLDDAKRILEGRANTL